MWPWRVTLRELHPTWRVTPLLSTAATPTHTLECLFRCEYEDICWSIFCHRKRRTNFKGNHNYSCGSNSFSAEYREAVEKFQAQFNPGRLFLTENRIFFFCSVWVRYRWCPWCRLWPGLQAAARAALWCPSERHGAALRSCGQDTQKQTGGGWGQRSRECGKAGGQRDEMGNKSLWWLQTAGKALKRSGQRRVCVFRDPITKLQTLITARLTSGALHHSPINTSDSCVVAPTSHCGF